MHKAIAGAGQLATFFTGMYHRQSWYNKVTTVFNFLWSVQKGTTDAVCFPMPTPNPNEVSVLAGLQMIDTTATRVTVTPGCGTVKAPYVYE
jgi:hypothetical protein